MQVRVMYFGAARERCGGTRRETLTLANGATVGDLADVLSERHPGLKAIQAQVRMAVNEDFAAPTQTLVDNDEVALIPPIAGGSGPWYRLSEEPLKVDEVVNAVRDPRFGAITVFIGLVRDHNDGRSVERLEYEAYESMTLKVFARILEECVAEQSSEVRMAVAHRYGRLDIGDIAVVVAAGSAHRADAFAAARAGIEKLKADAPIWKKEFTPDGVEWVGLGP